MIESMELDRFVAGNTRLRVIQDDSPIHPFILEDMASSLACWNDEYGSFLPDTCNEGAQKRLNKQYHLIESIADMQSWFDRAPQPYLAYGITYFDKYGGLVLHKDVCDKFKGIDQNDLEPYDGAIFIDEKRFCEYVENNPDMTYETMLERMESILRAEFDRLNAWHSLCVFGYLLEKKCPTCGQWEIVDDKWDFYCLTPDHSPMLKAMAEHLDSDDAEVQEIKKLMENA